jgi:uncharacterized membrane protein
MTTRTAIITCLVIVIGITIYTLALYPSLPDKIPTHWDINGEVDGWSDRSTGAWLGVGFVMFVFGLLLILPSWSPKAFSVDNFREPFNFLMTVITGWMALLQTITLYAAQHPQTDVGRLIIATICLLLAIIGNMLGKVRRNFWIGIRTPWTLASDDVWYATHRFGGRLMVLTSLISMVLIILGGPPAVAFIIIMIGVFAPIIFSMVLFKKLQKIGKA